MRRAVEKLRHAFPGFVHREIISHPDLMSREIRRFMAEAG